MAVDEDGVASYYATTRAIAWCGGLVILIGLIAFSPLFLPPGIPIWIFVCIAVSEVIWSRLVEVASAAFQGVRRMNRVAQLQLLLPVTRCCAAAVLVLALDEISLAVWTLFFLGSSMVCAVITSLVARRAFGKGRRAVRAYVSQWRQSALFSVSLASQSAYNDIDKAMLSSLGSLSANGIYSAAYRVVEIGFAPMRAVLSAAYPRFFAHGQQGLRGSLIFAKRLALPSLLLCALGTVALLLGSGFLPAILGDEYQESVEALRWLAVLPLVRGVQYLAADALTGAGHQGARSAAQAAVAVLNVGLNLVLIPAYSWQGAAVATLVCDALLAASLWLIVRLKLRQT